MAVAWTPRRLLTGKIMDKTQKQPTGSYQSSETALIAHKNAHVMATEPPGEPC